MALVGSVQIPRAFLYNVSIGGPKQCHSSISTLLPTPPTSAELIAHARVLEVADAILLEHCINYRIGSLTAINIQTAVGFRTEYGLIPWAGF